ncbi:SWIM zinc finger family protein [Rhizobacter sp. LjRoot28]|uniref:SWIM zinc finger family protein n=1 Tax=Rhizobacter sp. LjRoot28 TaxID=3342309 RepID=UPI003ED14B3D
MVLTIDEVLALAPDAASAKSARGLTSTGQWPLLGSDASSVWGECQGSGARPYQTQVDLSGPAFKCSCPSRKFPCKHGLALMLIRAQDRSALTSTTPPAWVSEWLASRADKAQKKDQKVAEKAAAPVDPAAALARETQRWARLTTAAAELQRWLADRMAQGLGAGDATDTSAWRTMAARMVDAQAPGLGQRLRDSADGLGASPDWPERTLHRLGLLQLACEALQRRETLPAHVQADLRTMAGWPFEKADVLAVGEAVDDRWTVLGVTTELRDAKLTERRVWLHGERLGRRAWVLEHAFAGQGFETAWTPGTAVDAVLTFYPGAAALRVATPDTVGPAGAARWPATDNAGEWRGIATRVAACPWNALHPLVLHAAVILRDGDHLYAVTDGRALSLRLMDADAWSLLAVSGGHPVSVMGEWDGQTLTPLTAWAGDDPPLWSRRPA